MPFGSSISTLHETARAIDEVCLVAQACLGEQPDLAVLFFSHHHAEQVQKLAGVREKLGASCLIGCTGESIVGTGTEIEHRPALSLWLAKWRQPALLTGFHLELEKTSEGYSLLGWPDVILDADPARSTLLVLGEPYTFPVDAFLEQIAETSPGLRVLGGMASGAHGPGENQLLEGDNAHGQGAVCLLIQGPAPVRGLVSQGCRPIGKPLVITKAKDNVIQQLGGETPLNCLQEVWSVLTPEERQLFQQGLHIGRVINEYQSEFQRGDFLIRNVLGLHRETGALIINDRVRVGQTVQLHIRDKTTADEDLREMLRREKQAASPQAALLFTCNGRGTRLFGQPHHDAAAIEAELGKIPVAGFFAQGELGPVGGQNFIHGFTASLALFQE